MKVQTDGGDRTTGNSESKYHIIKLNTNSPTGQYTMTEQRSDLSQKWMDYF